MADVTVTTSSVAAGADAQIESGTAGEAVTIGQTLYKSAADKWLKADSTSALKAGSNGTGIAITTAAADGQRVLVQRSGNINVGATLVVGTIYCASTNAAGGINPSTDLGSGDYVTVLGVASTASNLILKPIVSGVAVPS